MRRGFSLVELMVVVGILLILAGLLFPVFSQAKASAKARVCATGLEQCHRGVALYAADAEGLYPAAKDCLDVALPRWQPAWIQGLPLLPDAVFPYTRSKAIFRCPQDTGVHVSEGQFPERVELAPSAFDRCGMSYEYHTDLGALLFSDARLENPSGVNVLADMAGHWHGSTRALTTKDNFDGYAECVPGYRYNLLFADGHVRLVNHQDIAEAWGRG